MDQFIPADWTWSTSNGDAFAISCGQDDGLVDLLGCNGHAVIQSQPPQPQPWSPEMELLSEIFCPDAGGDSASPWPRGPDAMFNHDASTAVTSPSMRPRPPGKRKERDTTESRSAVMQDVEESDSAAATMCGPKSGKRRRAAQEHNLSERRRRDRINEKMMALQELIPHCNKTDRASMLDEAIEYLKSLQLQVQMMWTIGGGMEPAMFPASRPHQYIQRMASMRSWIPPFRS